MVVQKIVHDGLVGAAFLRRFDVTFDLARSSVHFAGPAGAVPPDPPPVRPGGGARA